MHSCVQSPLVDILTALHLQLMFSPLSCLHLLAYKNNFKQNLWCLETKCSI